MNEPNIDELMAWRNKVHQVDANLRTLLETPAETKPNRRIGWTRPVLSTTRLARAFHVPSGPIGSATSVTVDHFTSVVA